MPHAKLFLLSHPHPPHSKHSLPPGLTRRRQGKIGFGFVKSLDVEVWVFNRFLWLWIVGTKMLINLWMGRPFEVQEEDKYLSKQVLITKAKSRMPMLTQILHVGNEVKTRGVYWCIFETGQQQTKTRTSNIIVFFLFDVHLFETLCSFDVHLIKKYQWMMVNKSWIPSLWAWTNTDEQLIHNKMTA